VSTGDAICWIYTRVKHHRQIGGGGGGGRGTAAILKRTAIKMGTECGERGRGHWRGLGIAGRILKRIRDCWKGTEENKGLLEGY
jgi:hypothetical protein